MVNVVQALSSGASGAAQYARVSAASAALSTEPVESTVTVEAAAALPSEQTVLSAYRYNSFEFSYRQDFGKIVLLRQKPDTGEVVQQFPSEYYLRKYADSQRVAQTAANEHVGTGAGEKQAAVVTPQAVSGQSPTPTPTPAPQPAPSAAPAAPVISAAPALPGGGVGSNTALNLTV